MNLVFSGDVLVAVVGVTARAQNRSYYLGAGNTGSRRKGVNYARLILVLRTADLIK